MRIFLFLFTFFAGIGLVGPTAKEAAAQCTHLGAQGACPVGIPNGSNSVSFNADGTINWSSGGVSGPCCAQPSGTETGAGLQNLNNTLGGNNFHFGPTVTIPNPEADPFAGEGIIDIVGGDFLDLNGEPVCNFGSCSGDGLLGQVFGASPNSGYQCDSGGPGCGNDLWVSQPLPGFGSCGPGGCTSPAPIAPLPVANLPGTGPYAANLTTGNIDPFGSAGNTFVDPITGEPTELPENEEDWPERIKLAQELNNAHINGEIGYPFTDTEWDQKSVQYYKDNPLEAPVAPLAPPSVTSLSNYYQSTEAQEIPVVVVQPPNTFTNPYRSNLTQGNIDPFGGAGNFFQDPRNGDITELPDNEAEWPEKFKKAERLNSLYVSGHIEYPFNDPNWETKPESDFAKTGSTGTPAVASTFTSGGGLFTSAPVPDDRITVYPVQAGDTLFRIALRYGVTVKALQAANNLKDGDSVPVGQVLTIPTSTPASASVTTTTGESANTGASQPTESGARFSNKSRRFGIGAETTVPTDGLAARFQVAKNFGVQALVSFDRITFDTKDQSDLTNYVSTAVVATDPKNQPAPTTQPASQSGPRDPKRRFSSSRTVSHYTTRGPSVIEVTPPGEEPVYQVSVPSVGRILTFKNRGDAFNFSNRLRYDGESFDQTLQNLPDDRRPVPDRAATTNPLDAIAESVPVEFQFPKLTDRWDGEIHDIYVTNPRTGENFYLSNREQAEVFLDGIRGGMTWAEAKDIDFDATLLARNNGVVATSPDGLASATVRGGGRTPTGPATGGEIPIQLNNRPAIIVSPETSGSQGNTGRTDSSASDNAGSFSSVTGRENNLVVTPPRPAGQIAGKMTGILNGASYDIEIIRTPDGKTLAVGTGDNANHVFGEVRPTSNKLFGDWRREGPWTPPPANTGGASQAGNETFNPGGTVDVKVDTAVTDPAGNSVDVNDRRPGSGLTGIGGNQRIRSQIANSDRDHMIQPRVTEGFASGGTVQWRSTNR